MTKVVRSLLKSFFPNYKKELNESQISKLSDKMEINEFREFMNSDKFKSMDNETKVVFIRLLGSLPLKAKEKQIIKPPDPVQQFNLFPYNQNCNPRQSYYYPQQPFQPNQSYLPINNPNTLLK